MENEDKLVERHRKKAAEEEEQQNFETLLIPENEENEQNTREVEFPRWISISRCCLRKKRKKMDVKNPSASLPHPM